MFRMDEEEERWMGDVRCETRERQTAICSTRLGLGLVGGLTVGVSPKRSISIWDAAEDAEAVDIRIEY
jgi:hypothetical protein